MILTFFYLMILSWCKSFHLGINKGSAVFLHLLRELSQLDGVRRRVAFFHRNTSDRRKEEILKDLQLPLHSEKKQLLCVVATVSLGKSNDYRILHVTRNSGFVYLCT